MKTIARYPAHGIALAQTGHVVEVVEVEPNAEGRMIRTRPKGEADTVYSCPIDLDKLAAYAGTRRARQMAPRVYVLWDAPQCGGTRC